MNLTKEDLKRKLKLTPSSPGIYIMKNIKGEVIYIGKSNNLRQRVSSYFQPSSLAAAKVRKIVKNLYDFEYIITKSEIEALILECNLIKEYRPRYNVKFKDGKGYPYIKITSEEFPRLIITRKVRQDKGKYYGPYTKGLRSYLKLFWSLFPLRNCKGKVKPDRRNRPCMKYHIKRCSGPCLGEINRENYKKIVTEACRFLEGRHRGLLKKLEGRINEYAKNLEFERAASVRDQLYALKNYSEQQKVVFTSPEEEGDFIGSAAEDGTGCIEVYYLREGSIVRQERFLMDRGEDDEKKDLVSAFIKQFYIDNTDIPQKIYLEEEPAESLLEELLISRRGGKVNLIIPKRGKKKELLEMAGKNAEIHLRKYLQENREAKERAKTSLLELKSALSLPRMPLLIEAFDISNISGKDAVGSMIVFEKGVPKKSSYRRFKIKRTKGPDDYGMMKEVMERRYCKIIEDTSEREPDLILVDGGMGQLNIAVRVLESLELSIAVIGLAKEEENVFKPFIKTPVKIDKTSQAMYLLQRIRDEAHRFAVTYHRKLRLKRTTASALDGILGIGKVRKKNLLEHFGSVKEIKRASIKEIASVKGMNKKAAEVLYRSFRNK